jgi:hypothetical protein
MSAPLPLLVPPPVLAFKAVAGTFAPLEDVVAVSFPAVRFADGTAMTAEDLRGAQALLTRTAGPASHPEVWDPVVKSWRAAGTIDLAQVSGLPLLPPRSGAAPWEGILTGAGQKDAAGAPLIEPAVGSFPQYRLRGSFRAKRGDIEAFGLGPESPALEFASVAASKRFTAELGPDPDAATRVRLMLRDAAARPVGLLEIDASAGNAVLTLRNFDGSGGALASVTLQADGAIRLAPGSGMNVIVAGDLEAERIHYLPSSGLPRKTLD